MKAYTRLLGALAITVENARKKQRLTKTALAGFRQ